MSNQEQQFFGQEQYANQYRPYVNADPREQQQSMYGEPEYYAHSWEKLQPQRPRRRKNGRVFPVIVLLIACLAFAGLLLAVMFGFVQGIHDRGYGIHDKGRRGESNQTFLVTGTPKLVINNGSGSVYIRSDENITDRVTVNASQRAITENYDPKTNTITITTNGGEVDFVISTPKTTDIQLNEDSGLVDIEGITGQMNIEDKNGSISANNISALNNQQIRIHTDSDSISAENVTGQVDLSSGSGSISVSQGTLSGKSSLHSNDGSISFDGSLDSNGAYDFETSSGSINVSLPNHASFHLDASTKNGSSNNDFGGNNVGNGTRPPLKLRSENGSIEVHKG